MRVLGVMLILLISPTFTGNASASAEDDAWAGLASIVGEEEAMALRNLTEGGNATLDDIWGIVGPIIGDVGPEARWCLYFVERPEDGTPTGWLTNIEPPRVDVASAGFSVQVPGAGIDGFYISSEGFGKSEGPIVPGFYYIYHNVDTGAACGS